jgi:hypothetical protein
MTPRSKGKAKQGQYNLMIFLLRQGIPWEPRSIRVCCSWAPHFAESTNSNLPASPALLFLGSAFRGVQEQQSASQPSSAVLGLRISRSPGTAICQPAQLCCSWTPHFAESRNSNLPASPAANSLEIRIAGRQVPKPRCLSPAANSLEIRIAGRQVQCTAPEHAYAAWAMPLARL